MVDALSVIIAPLLFRPQLSVDGVLVTPNCGKFPAALISSGNPIAVVCKSEHEDAELAF